MTIPNKAEKIPAVNVGGCLKQYAGPNTSVASFRQIREKAWEEAAREKPLKSAEEKR